MDDFLRNEALKGEHGCTWVVTAERGSPKIMGFYTVDPEPSLIAATDEYGEHPVGTVELHMLGVAKDLQGRGFGSMLVDRLIESALRVAVNCSVNYILLRVLNQRSKNWYLSRNWGFVEAAPGSAILLLPVGPAHRNL